MNGIPFGGLAVVVTDLGPGLGLAAAFGRFRRVAFRADLAWAGATLRSRVPALPLLVATGGSPGVGSVPRSSAMAGIMCFFLTGMLRW